MSVDKYMAKFQLSSGSSAFRCRDSTIVTPELMVEVHEHPNGDVHAYAVSPPRASEHDQIIGGAMPSPFTNPTLREAGHDVLVKRNEELVAENAALREINKKLEEQNREMLDRLMAYADMAFDTLHGTQPSPKKPPRKRTSKSNGVPEEERT